MEKAKVKETFIDSMFRRIKAMQGKNDIKNSTSVNPFGYDSVPYEGVAAVRTDTKSDTVIVGYIQVAFQDLEVGESVMFSKTKEGYKATIVCRNSGNIEFNGTGDNLTRFKDLKSGFDELKKTVNDALTQIKLHTHTVTGSVTGIPSGITVLNSTASIDNCKAESLETK